jgi:Zn-dependent M28 family amino/carboxypeptidase
MEFRGSNAYDLTAILAEDIGTRFAGTGKDREAAEFVGFCFRESGFHTVFQSFANPAGAECRNAIAFEDAVPESYIVVGAHYDTVGTTIGANDNASGIAVMLEAARVLANEDLPIPVVFVAFGSEEGSHAGSKHFVASCESASAVRGMVNLDAVGIESHMEIGSYGKVDPWLKDHCTAAARRLGSESVDGNFGGKSDYAAFADAGIPVACFARVDHPSAHTWDDNMGIISARGMEEFGRVLVESLRTLPTM